MLTGISNAYFWHQGKQNNHPVLVYETHVSIGYPRDEATGYIKVVSDILFVRAKQGDCTVKDGRK